MAQPTAWIYWVARLPEIVKKPSVRDQEAGLAIGWKIHVAWPQSFAEGTADGLFAHMLHIERGLALPLRHQHAGIEGPQGHHVAQAFEQLGVSEETGPGADGLALSAEHADDRKGEIADR